MKVNEAIIEVMKDVGAVGKGDRNTFHNFNFRGIDAVVNALSPAMKRHGVTVHPSQIIARDYEHYTTDKNKQGTACRLVVEYTITGPEGDVIHCVAAGESADTGDKATPKAMSVTFRTALLQTFALPTTETDPDAQVMERQAPRPVTGEASNLPDFRGMMQSATTPDEKNAIWNQAKEAGAPVEFLDELREIGS